MGFYHYMIREFYNSPTADRILICTTVVCLSFTIAYTTLAVVGQ